MTYPAHRSSTRPQSGEQPKSPTYYDPKIEQKAEAGILNGPRTPTTAPAAKPITTNRSYSIS